MNKIFLSLFLVISLISTAWANNGWYSTLQGTASDVEQDIPSDGVILQWSSFYQKWLFAYGVAPSGGTTGQVLTKNSGSNYDYSWTTPSGGGGAVSSVSASDASMIVTPTTGAVGVGVNWQDFTQVNLSGVNWNQFVTGSPWASMGYLTTVNWAALTILNGTGVNWSAFYPTSNPSGYITNAGINWSAFPNTQGYLNTINWAGLTTANGTGVNWQSFYPTSNPLGWLTSWTSGTTTNMTGVNWQSFFPTASMGSTNWSDYDLLSKNQTITGTKKFSNGIETGLIYPASDSTTAIQFNKANGTTNVLDIDTTNGNVGIGTTSPSSSFGAVGALIHLQGVQPGIVLQNNISLLGQIIQFDVSWPTDNFQNVNGATNAAWVFFKYKVNSTGVYYTAHLISGGSATPTADGMGAFVQQGTGQTVMWNYVGDGVLPTNVTIYAFSLEMVKIPTGSFYVGDGTSSSVTGQFCAANNHTTPFEITSQGALTLGGGGAGSLGNNNASGMNVADDFNDSSSKSLPSTFPEGYNAFYMMKYDVTQGQWRDFLNTLTRAQQNGRVVDGSTNDGTNLSGLTSLPTNVYVMSNSSTLLYRNGIKVITIPSSSAAMTFGCYLNAQSSGIVNGTDDGEWVAMNYLSWQDGAAYAAWAGLRPFTELEYENAARGPSSFDTGTANEYAWGNTTLTNATGFSGTTAGTSSETTTPSGANCLITGGISGPVRGGTFATSSSSRASAGAGYWGIMDLSGNLWKRPVTVGNSTGRAFVGSNGSGVLSSDGSATNTDWPGYTSGEINNNATGSGVRGGAWNGASTYARVSDRISTAYALTSRSDSFGARFARTSP